MKSRSHPHAVPPAAQCVAPTLASQDVRKWFHNRQHKKNNVTKQKSIVHEDMQARADRLKGAVHYVSLWQRLPVLNDGVLLSIFSVNDKGDKQQPRTQHPRRRVGDTFTANGVDRFHQIRKRCTMGGPNDISARQFVHTMTRTIRQLREALNGGEFAVCSVVDNMQRGHEEYVDPATGGIALPPL